MKAFLSHSTKDKKLVEIVANLLGRASVVLDQYCFQTGTNFEEAITNGLNQSDIFVLFASQHSLASDWVQTELTEASQRNIHREIKKVLVYTIDDETTVSDLPNWLQKGLVRNLQSPKLIADEVQMEIQKNAKTVT